MTTIIVPTDFSPAANNAARYALQLAKMSKTAIELCQGDADHTELQHFARQLEREDSSVSPPDSYHPRISTFSGTGTTRTLVDARLSELKTLLVVMGSTVRDSRSLIETAGFPILLVPPDGVFRSPKKIALATDLSRDDIEVVHALAGFARFFNAELLLVHCTDERYDGNQVQQTVDDFLREVTGKAGYDKIYYRQVKSTGVDRGLDWLAQHGQIDMLAMVHRPHHWLSQLIRGSHTKEMAGHIKLPLLVFPPGYCGVL